MSKDFVNAKSFVFTYTYIYNSPLYLIFGKKRIFENNVEFSIEKIKEMMKEVVVYGTIIF